MENDDEDKYTSVSDDPLSNLILEVIKNDSLRKIERSRRNEAEHCILTAAKLISPVINPTFDREHMLLGSEKAFLLFFLSLDLAQKQYQATRIVPYRTNVFKKNLKCS